MHKRLDVLDVDLIDFVGWEEGEGVGDVDVDVEDDLAGVRGRLKDIDDDAFEADTGALGFVALRNLANCSTETKMKFIDFQQHPVIHENISIPIMSALRLSYPYQK